MFSSLLPQIGDILVLRYNSNMPHLSRKVHFPLFRNWKKGPDAKDGHHDEDDEGGGRDKDRDPDVVVSAQEIIVAIRLISDF